jgi:hypothetical protein
MNILNFIGGIFLSLASFFGAYTQPTQPITFGSVYPVGGSTFYLAGSGITSSASTVTLTSFQTPDGRSLTMSMFGTVGYGAFEPGSSKLEDITFSGITQNANGTATLTGVTRGNDFITPYAASTTLAKAHAGGVPFILSNTPGFYTQFMPLNNTATSSAVMVFSSTTPPRLDNVAAQGTGTYIATTSEFASVAYVNAVALTSAPNGTTGVKGVYQTATGLQAASSTATGSTGAQLVLGNGIATDTPSVPQSVSGSHVIMSDITGYLKHAWLNLSDAFTWTGAHIFNSTLTANATTTIAASSVTNNALVLNGVSTQWPSANSLGLLRNDGTGILSWGTPTKYETTSSASVAGTGTAIGYATSTLMYIPALTASSTISVMGYGNCVYNGGCGSWTLALSDGTPIVSGGSFGGTNGSTSNGIYTCEVSFFSSSSQHYVCNGVGGLTLSIVGGAGTTAVDFSTAKTLVLTVQSATTAANNQYAVSGFSVVVNP